jgi:hypothetical protein
MTQAADACPVCRHPDPHEILVRKASWPPLAVTCASCPESLCLSPPVLTDAADGDRALSRGQQPGNQAGGT